MRLKYFSLFIGLILSISVSYGQTAKAEIEKQFTEYTNSILKKDFAKSMNYISDDFFKIIPKEQLIKIMENVFNNADMEIDLKSPVITEINDIQKIENKFYSLLKYTNIMNLKLLNSGIKNESAESKKTRNDLTKASFELTFGLNNVKFDEINDKYEILVEKQVYAISDNGENSWKFIVVEKEQKTLLEKILPKQLTDKI